MYNLRISGDYSSNNKYYDNATSKGVCDVCFKN